MTLTERISEFELFQGCSAEFIDSLALMAKSHRVEAGTTILVEGEMNDRLLILASGEVEVRVNGERVAALDKPGDLIGEISVLAHRPVTASVHAINSVEFLEIRGVDIEANLTDSHSEFRFGLYRLLSEVLSDKIILTNDKARQFEIANRALVEINRTLDQKVQERTDATFKKLAELQSSLVPLLDLVSKETSVPLARASSQLQSSIDMIRGMAEMYSSERAVRSRRVLIAEPDRKQQTIARMALGGTGVKIETVMTGEEALDLLSTAAPFDLIFLSSELSPFIPQFEMKQVGAKLVVMASSDLNRELASLKAHAPLISHFVSRNSEDRMFTVKNIATTVTKLISHDLFGLEKYMMWGVETKERTVKHSAEREPLITEMQEHFKSLGVRSTVFDKVATVAEELLMNAIYDAPTNEHGVHTYAHLDRKTDVRLKPIEFAQLRYACDGMMAAVSVSDPFGGMKLETLFDYLKRNLGSADVIQDAGKGGAGRGLHQVVENSDLVVFNVQPGTKTEVVVCFNLDPNAKSQDSHPFHFFKG